MIECQETWNTVSKAEYRKFSFHWIKGVILRFSNPMFNQKCICYYAWWFPKISLKFEWFFVKKIEAENRKQHIVVEVSIEFNSVILRLCIQYYTKNMKIFVCLMNFQNQIGAKMIGFQEIWNTASNE